MTTATAEPKVTIADGDAIECPHGCGAVMGDLWDYNWTGNSEQIITECGECEKPITLRRSVSVTYLAYADEEDD